MNKREFPEEMSLEGKLASYPLSPPENQESVRQNLYPLDMF